MRGLTTPSRLAVLRPGDRLLFDGAEHRVVALAGTSVRLRSAAGAESVVLASHLMAAPGFAVVDGSSAPEVEPFGLLDGLPDDVLAAARDWQRHVVEVETGLPPLPPDATPGTRPRPDRGLPQLSDRPSRQPLLGNHESCERGPGSQPLNRKRSLHTV